MRSTATELGTPRIRVSSREVEGVDPLEPGVPRRLGELGPDGGRDLCPQVICGWSAHAGGSPSCPQVCPHVWRSGRSVDPSTPRPCAPGGGWGSSDARGRPGRWGRGRYQRHREAHKGSSGERSTPRRVGKRRPSGGFPRSTARKGRIAAPRRRPVHCTVRLPGAPVPGLRRLRPGAKYQAHRCRAAPRAHSLGPGFRGGHA